MLYLLAVFTLPYIGVNKKQHTEQQHYTVYILTNGVHTDLVLPVKNALQDWTPLLSYDHTVAKDTQMNYVAFGWGDKGFYLETPTWADLKASTAFKAMFFLSTAAMHVTFYHDMQRGEYCRKVALNEQQYRRLVQYISASFRQDTNGAYCYIPGHAYGRNDGFYDARGVYNLFFTCNTWANSGLKSAGLRACLWTALDKGIFYQYR